MEKVYFLQKQKNIFDTGKIIINKKWYLFLLKQIHQAFIFAIEENKKVNEKN